MVEKADMAAVSSVDQTKLEELQPESNPARQTRTVQEDPRYIMRIESSPEFIGLDLTRQTPGYSNRPYRSPATLLDGTNVRLNWNIESDMNFYWI
jgi:hypothetical protein